MYQQGEKSVIFDEKASHRIDMVSLAIIVRIA
jgi:hypothetical protein